MQVRGSRWLLVVASALATAALVLAVEASDAPPSERKVERELRALSARGGLRLHAARCIRDDVLPRTFVCLVEAPDDTHLAWRVRSLPDGRLDVRRPNGSRIRF